MYINLFISIHIIINKYYHKAAAQSNKKKTYKTPYGVFVITHPQIYIYINMSVVEVRVMWETEWNAGGLWFVN